MLYNGRDPSRPAEMAQAHGDPQAGSGLTQDNQSPPLQVRVYKRRLSTN